MQNSVFGPWRFLPVSKSGSGFVAGLAVVLLTFACSNVQDESTTPSVASTMTSMPDTSIGQDAEWTADAGMSANGRLWPNNVTLPSREGCEPLAFPIVAAHGFLASGDTWSPHQRRLVANGFCGDRFHAFNWNSLDRNTDQVGNLALFINDVLQRTGAEQVDLMGHSAGGLLAYEYLADPEKSAQVRRYVHIGSSPSDAPPGPSGGPGVPILNIWSSVDTIVEGGDIPQATNVQLAPQDHYQVATSEASFEAIFNFLVDDEPENLKTSRNAPALVSGYQLTLGENDVIENGVIEAWIVDAATGRRIEPAQRFEVDEFGAWGPLVAQSGLSFELAGIDPNPGASDVRHYFEPFVGDTALTCVRGFPGPGGLAGGIVNLLPQTADQTTLVVYNARGAFIAGRDSLTLNGNELLTPETASAESTTIAYFIYDLGMDGETGGSSPLFDAFPFLGALDVPLNPDPNGVFELIFNGRRIAVPATPSDEAIVLAVFE